MSDRLPFNKYSSGYSQQRNNQNTDPRDKYGSRDPQQQYGSPSGYPQRDDPTAQIRRPASAMKTTGSRDQYGASQYDNRDPQQYGSPHYESRTTSGYPQRDDPSAQLRRPASAMKTKSASHDYKDLENMQNARNYSTYPGSGYREKEDEKQIKRYAAVHQENAEETEEVDPDIQRKESRKQMWSSYKSMQQSSQRYQERLGEMPEWTPVKTKHAVEPDEMTVTHVNQTQALVSSANLDAKFAQSQSSTEWLKNHSIESMNLTLKNLVDKGTIGRPSSNKETGKVQQHIQFESKDINEFEYKLNLVIETFTARIKWLLQGSKRMFGMLKGSKLGVVVDSSEANCGFGRLTAFQNALTHLIDEQISEKRAMYLMSFGTEPAPLWEQAMDINCRTDDGAASPGQRRVEESKEWVARLEGSGGCNLLKALRHMYKIKGIDSIVIILGSAPDQNAGVLIDYATQLACGRNLPIQTVAYDCTNNVTNETLKRIAEETGGRYHCYASTNEEQIYTGTDISLLLKEIQKAQDVINKIKDMRNGLLGTALVSVMNEISDVVSKLPQSRFLPRPPGHENPLNIDMPQFQPSASSEWLDKHGLKAKQLDLYQVLAPNAFSFREEFVPVIRKTVQSQVHGKAMAQFTWYDGSIKNVHVDMTQLFEYQKQLGATVRLYEKRVDWLSSASRKIFGTVAEKNVIILVDTSVSNINYLVHVQHSIRLLLEQQMANKEYFNVIAFGSTAKAWRPTLVRPTPENLQHAWRWILDIQCEGSRNFMGALHLAVENDEEARHGVEADGIYLFTSGIPDQSQDIAVSYVEEATAGRDSKLHVVLFNVDDYDSNGAIPGRYANITKTAECLRSLAHCSGGRFHWFRETGIIESDDIAAITFEIEKALNFSKKSAMLVESVKKKYDLDYSSPAYRMLNGNTVMQALPAPTPKHNCCLSDDEGAPKAIKWRPTSAPRQRKVKELQEDEGSSSSDSRTISSAKTRPKSAKIKKKVVQKEFFYTEDKKGGEAVGIVYKKYPSQKSVRKAVGGVPIPEKEDQMTTKEWLKRFSLHKLKMDLNKLVSGPDCKHTCKPVKTLQKQVDARVCNVFPTINVGGTLKHLQLQPKELKNYEEQVIQILTRYLKRLQWLLAGSRRVFGTVIERRVTVLIDTSGSMEPYMEELKKELASLIWDQFHRNNIKFNMIRFSKNCEKWKSNIVAPTEDHCHDAVKWVSTFSSHGNTCTLDALEMAFEDTDLEAIYLLTDGKPDCSTSLVMKEVAKLNEDRNIVINTISFNCDDSTANSFLKLLATTTIGRYHKCQSCFDADKFAHSLLTEGFDNPEMPRLPNFEGDDLKRLGEEISMARRYLSQSRSYRDMYSQHTSRERPDGRSSFPHDCFKDVTVGPGANGTSKVTVGPGGRIQPKSAKPKA